MDALFASLDWAITAARYLPRSGQFLDTMLIVAPWQRNTDGEKAQIKEGWTAAESWPDKPAKARQKDVDGRWTVKYSKATVRADGPKPVDIAISIYGYKSYISIDRMHGVIGRQVVTDATRHDVARLHEGLIQRPNTVRDVEADSAYPSAENQALADEPRDDEPHSSQEAAWLSDAKTDQPGQFCEIGAALENEARLRTPEGAHALGDPGHWYRARQGNYNTGQHG